MKHTVKTKGAQTARLTKKVAATAFLDGSIGRLTLGPRTAGWKGMDFTDAMRAMKGGARVRRHGWNGKDVWICLGAGLAALPADKFWNEHTKNFAVENGGTAEVLPYIIMKTADNKILMGWLASQSDMLASDYEILL